MKIKTLDDITPIFRSYAHTVPMRKNYNLDRIRALLALIGDPQDSLKVVHIAGTSGKTSTAYFIRALLESAGMHTGLTVSPFIVSVTERAQIDGAPLPDDEFLKYVNEFIELVDSVDGKGSYFELMITFAYWLFTKLGVDYAVVETGLGGMFDGTNVVSRRDKVCVISDIGFDHTEILGDTIKEIAIQKAGIIQPGNYVIAQAQDDEIMNIFAEAAHRQGSKLQVVNDNRHNGVDLPAFQQRNWRLACAAYDYVAKRDGLRALQPQDYAAATKQVPPGRFEIFKVAGKTVILDGAHNPQKLHAFVEALAAKGITRAPVMANVMQAPDKKVEACIHELAALTTRLLVPGFRMSQDLDRVSVPIKDFAKLAHKSGIKNVSTYDDVRAALKELLRSPEDTVIITGSLYMAHFARELLVKLS